MTGVGLSGPRRVQALLADGGWPNQVVELPRTTRRAIDAAEAVGCTVEQIVKSLIFRGQASDRVILVMASGVNRVDEARLAALVGEPIGKADADFVRQRTGYAIGGVAPIGHREPVVALIDADLLRHERIWAAAGSPNAVFALTPDQLVAMTGGTVAVVA
jgi:prolyl-tRNA editing enzyme YbaK/EbsC (Cys-tRNA(Pro) deacylase)